MNILFSINRSFIPLLMSCLKSIARNGGAEDYSIYILHSDLLPQDQEMINDKFCKRMDMHFIAVDNSMFEGFPEFKRYPLQIYYRLVASQILPKDLERILYLDVDTVVINSLIPLYELPFDGSYYMACTHTGELLTKINRKRLGIEQDTPYINSGVMMLNLSAIRKNFDMNAICEFAREKKNVLILPDQDILTALYGNKLKLLDSMIYNLSDRVLNIYNADLAHEKVDLEWVRKNSVVIHYFGRNKPWKEKYHGVLGVFYHEINASENERKI